MSVVCGTRIIIRGLVSRPEFNGQVGTVVIPPSGAKSLVSVCLDKECSVKKLKVGNLRRAPASVAATPPNKAVDLRELCEALSTKIRTERDSWTDASSPTTWLDVTATVGCEVRVKPAIISSGMGMAIGATNLESSSIALRSEALVAELAMMTVEGDARKQGRAYEARARSLEPGCMMVAALLAHVGGEDERYMALLRDGAALGSALCQFTLGDLILGASASSSEEEQQKADLALELFARAADGGSAHAAFRVAEIRAAASAEGERGADAARWYERALKLGSDDAACTLARSATPGRALELWQHAADHGASRAAKRALAQRLVEVAADESAPAAERSFALAEELLWEAVAAGEDGEAWWTLAMLAMRKPEAAAAPPLFVAALCARFAASAAASVESAERRAKLESEVPRMVQSVADATGAAWSQAEVRDALAAARSDALAQSFVGERLAAAAQRNMRAVASRYLTALADVERVAS